MKRTISASIIALLAFGLLSPADAAVKAGGTCTKAGATTTAGGLKYTCVKSGKKLVWNKGVKVASNVAKPSPSPSATILPIADPLERCKLPVADGRGDVSIGGWPRIAERSKVLGEVVSKRRFKRGETIERVARHEGDTQPDWCCNNDQPCACRDAGLRA